MNCFQLRILTPEKEFFRGEVQCVSLSTTEGSIGILAGHEPLVANLSSTPVRITDSHGEKRVAALSGGMLKVSPKAVMVLGMAAEWADEIDLDWARRSEQDARNKKENAKSEHDLNRAEAKLRRALNRIRVSSMK